MNNKHAFTIFIMIFCFTVGFITGILLSSISTDNSIQEAHDNGYSQGMKIGMIDGYNACSDEHMELLLEANKDLKEIINKTF